MKMSEFTPATASLFAEMIAANFAEDEVSVVRGDASVAHSSPQLPFDHLLSTGSTPVGHHVTMRSGGESDAGHARTRRQVAGDHRHQGELPKAVERIVVGKSLNAGQTHRA